MVKMLDAAFPGVRTETVSDLRTGQIEWQDRVLTPGMTLLDWYTGQALMGYCAAFGGSQDPDWIARRAKLAAEAVFEGE